MNTRFAIAALALSSLLGSGCATIVATQSRSSFLSPGLGRGPYAGTQIDLALMVECPPVIPLALIDLPLSLTADTLRLPVQAVQAWRRHAASQPWRHLDRLANEGDVEALSLAARTGETAVLRDRARQLLLRQGPAALPMLPRLLDTNAVNQLHPVLAALGPDATALLVARSQDPRVRPGRTSALKALHWISRHVDRREQRTAILAPALPSLTHRVEARDGEALDRVLALEVLASCDREAAVALALPDPSGEVRTWAAQTTHAERVLVEASVDPDARVRRAAFDGLLTRVRVEPEVLLPLIARDPDEALRTHFVPKLTKLIEARAKKAAEAKAAEAEAKAAEAEAKAAEAEAKTAEAEAKAAESARCARCAVPGWENVPASERERRCECQALTSP